jgi:hypothetical protein
MLHKSKAYKTNSKLTKPQRQQGFQHTWNRSIT